VREAHPTREVSFCGLRLCHDIVRTQFQTGWSVAREPHDGAVHLPVANWYRLLVSNAWQVDKILQELQSVGVTVAASLRARQQPTKITYVSPMMTKRSC
jgi:hypothetical protein